ncbi:Gp19/Gp15/Gp42 family protein [Rothia nasimurium]|uniref:Gp19/Gp15/Gp42 family protein n=1 Tax=Rothia nasimurium TaxID=85336 RepID=UPI001F21BAC0|nr:Gp19/Gp15/Gp42 family protein [Rothia nasimurium]
MAVATAKDVEVSLMRELTASETEYVGELLNRAEAMIRQRIPTLSQCAEKTEFTEILIAVEAESVARVFRNPSAYQQETLGSYSYSLNYRVASGLLDILEDEWKRLGITSWATVAPETDGYARARYGGRPDLQFQFGWPAQNHISEVVYGNPL